jgi:hypothetical protein
MLTETFQRKVIHASGQATLPIINKSNLSALSVWLPPKVADLREIAAQLDALSSETNRLAALYQQKLAGHRRVKKRPLSLHDGPDALRKWPFSLQIPSFIRTSCRKNPSLST